MGIDKSKISAPMPASRDALARKDTAASSNWLGATSMNDLLAKLASKDGGGFGSSPRKRVKVDKDAISLPLEREDVRRSGISTPTATSPLPERKDSRRHRKGGPKVSKDMISGPVSAPVMVAGSSTLTKLMMEDAGPTPEALKTLGMEPDIDLIALDEAWERTRKRAPTPGLPEPAIDGMPVGEKMEAVEAAEGGPEDAIAAALADPAPSGPPDDVPLVAPIFPIRPPPSTAPDGDSEGPAYQETKMENVFGSDGEGTKPAPAALPEEGEAVEGLGASSHLRTADDFGKTSTAPFLAGGKDAKQSEPRGTKRKVSVLKELEADYRWDVSANRQSRLEEDRRREQERLENERVLRESGRAMSIWAAAYNGNLARVQQLIESRAAGPNEWDSANDNVTPLHLASAQNHVEVARYLLGKGADPNLKAGKLDATPLHWGCKSGHVEIVHLLYKAGGDPTIKDGQGFDCLQLALSSGRPGCVAYMVAVMGDLFQAAHFGILERMVYLLDNQFYAVDDTQPGSNGATALHLAAVNGHVRCVEYLGSKGADLEAKAGEAASTPLLWAARAGNLPSVRKLVELGADPRYRDRKGFNALNFAQQLNPPHPEMVQFFVKECKMDSADAVPAVLAGAPLSEDVADTADEFAAMDEIELRAEQKLRGELAGLTQEEVAAFYANRLEGPGVRRQLKRGYTEESVDSQAVRNEADFDPYDTSEIMDPICLATVIQLHMPLQADELPLTSKGQIVRVLRKFGDFWSLGEIDEKIPDEDGGVKVKRRRGFYPTSYVEDIPWGEIAAARL